MCLTFIALRDLYIKPVRLKYNLFFLFLKNIKFFKRKKNKLYFDLTNYIYTSLKIIKIKHIDVLKIDTFDIKNKFFSARRALKLKHNDYGRNISIIMLN